jgi:eukaryotic-like serine/threonine-protein kinase
MNTTVIVDSAAYHLEGLVLDGGWYVLGKAVEHPDRSAGLFSVGYYVKDGRGRLGFLKALDYAEALDADDPAVVLQELTAGYNFERDLCRRCGQRSLSRVVRILDDGTVRVKDYSPGAVTYIVFELADGDARDLLDRVDVSDDCMHALRAAHHVTVGLRQLHGSSIAHQDIKPSNVLFWEDGSEFSGKIGDLGRAFDPAHPAPHDDIAVPGDCLHAPPELLYANGLDRPLNWRYAADNFLLGNLYAYLACGYTYGVFQALYLDRSHTPARWSGDFQDVLPYLIDAHGLATARLRDSLHSEFGAELAQMVSELCYPDPRGRGDPVERRWGNRPRYSLDRYVTRLDLLMRRVVVRRAMELS